MVAGYAQSLQGGNTVVSTEQFLSSTPHAFPLLWQGLSRGGRSFRNIHLFWCKSSTDGEEYLLHHGPPSPPPPPHPPPPPPPPLTFVFSLLVFTLLCSLLSLRYFLPSITFSQRWRHLGWWTQLCPVVGPFWSELEPSVSSKGQSLASSPRSHPCSPRSTITPVPSTPSNPLFSPYAHAMKRRGTAILLPLTFI